MIAAVGRVNARKREAMKNRKEKRNLPCAGSCAPCKLFAFENAGHGGHRITNCRHINDHIGSRADDALERVGRENMVSRRRKPRPGGED